MVPIKRTIADVLALEAASANSTISFSNATSSAMMMYLAQLQLLPFLLKPTG